MHRSRFVLFTCLLAGWCGAGEAAEPRRWQSVLAEPFDVVYVIEGNSLKVCEPLKGPMYPISVDPSHRSGPVVFQVERYRHELFREELRLRLRMYGIDYNECQIRD